MSRIRYSNSELQILWYLKRNGPLEKSVLSNRDSLLQEFADILGLGIGSIRYSLRKLEEQSILLRTYTSGKPEFGGGGGSYLIKIELIDPDMTLPPITPVPLGVVVAKENEELYQRTTHEPSLEDVLVALLEENEKLRTQIVKLQDIVEEQANKLIKVEKIRRVPDHLTERVKNALSQEQWDRITHGQS